MGNYTSRSEFNYEWNSNWQFWQEFNGRHYSQKKNSKNRIKGYRPISLLNYDYKLFSSIIKTRLEKLVPLIVSDRQAACNRSRNITYALCHVRDKLMEMTHKKCNGVMISLDFDHAFDRRSHHFLLDLFAKLNINIQFIVLITRMLDNMFSRILINGLS
jgi:hypothetical protein